MKKILAVFVAFLCVTAAMAEKRIIRSALLSVPIDHEYWAYDVLKSTGIDVEFNKMRVMESKFSTIFGIGLGYASSKLYDYHGNAFDWRYNMFNMNLKFGLGGAFVNTEKVIFAMHGFLGASGKFGKSNDEDKPIAYSGLGHVGFDLALAVLFTKSIGISAGLDVSCLVGCGGTKEPAESVGFSIVPKVGVAFAF